MPDSNPPAKTRYTVSRRQLEALVAKAGPEAVHAALIQNGSAPGVMADFSISKPQLDKLVERAGKEAVDVALIQNGSMPVAFTS